MTEAMSAEEFLKTLTGKMLAEAADDREEAFKAAIAEAAEAPLYVVDRVLDLMFKLEELEAVLKVVDGEVTVVEAGDDNDNDIALPQSLWDKIDKLEFDIVETLPHILKAWQERYGHPYPTMMRFTIPMAP